MALSFKEILDNASSVLGSVTKNKASSGGPSFNDITANVGRYVAQTQQPTISARQKSVADDFATRIGTYDWKSNYAYDVWSDEDAQRQERGEIPLSLYDSYDLDDPVDRYLYNNNLPPKKDLEKWAEKAEKEAETAAEETTYEQYRAQIAEAEKDPFEKLVGGVKAAISKGNALQKETAPKAAEEAAAGDVAALTDAVFGNAPPVVTQQPNKLATWLAGLDAKFDNPGAQAYWDRVMWEANNMREATDEELQPLVDELLKTGDYKGSSVTSAMATGAGYTTAEEKALKDARDQYRRQQEQKWLEYVGAPKDAEGNFLYGKYDYEGRVVANEMTQAAVNSAGFKPLDQLQAEAEAEGRRLEGIYKTTERTAQMAQPIYLQMTDEQKAAYYYYKERGKGDEYLDALTPELTDKAAEATKQLWTEEFPVPIIGDALLAFTGGLESGTKGLVRLATDNYAARTDGVSAQAAQKNRAEVAQNDDLWSKLAGIGLDVLYSTGNMAPSMVVGAANPILGAATIGASSAGNAINEARKEGATEEQAVLYGLMSGTAEAALQYLLGGIGKLSKGVTGDALGKGATRLLGRVFKNPKVAQAFKARAGSVLAEAGEEYIQGIIDPVIRNIALNEDNIISLLNEEAGYGALLGAITGGLLGGSGTVAENATTINTTTAETPAQAQTEAPVETVQATGAPVHVGVGDTVTLQDGTTATVQGVSHDPFNNVEMYSVESDGQVEWLTAYEIERTTPTANVKSDLVTTGLKFKPMEEYTPEERKRINEYINSTDPNIVNEVMRYRANKDAPNKRIKVSNVSPGLMGEITKQLGFDSRDYTVWADRTSFTHIERRHGENGNHDQTMSDANDVGRLAYVIENPDSVEWIRNKDGEHIYSSGRNGANGKPAPIFQITKKIDGTYYVSLATAENKHKKIWIETAFTNKTGVTQATDAITGRVETSETGPASPPNNSILDVATEGNTQSELETAIAEYNAEEEAIARLEREGREMEQWISEGYSENTAREIAENAGVATLPVVLAQEETGSALLPAEQANKLADSVSELSARGVRPTKTLDQNLDYAAHNNRELRNVLHDVFVKDWREAQRREATNRVQKVDGYLKEAERIGIERGSLEEQATMWYGQGYKSVQNETGDWVPQPYGIRDLMKDCPDTWKKVVEFDRVNRELYDQYARELTELYKRIYPNVEERASRQLESAAARSQQREADYEAAQNRVRELETQLMEAETALSNKGRTDTKAFETVQNRVNRMERQLTEAQQNMLRRKELADEANVLLMNLDHAVKDGSFFQGKRFFPRANYYAHMMSDSDNGVIEAINELRTGGKGISPQLAGKSEFTKPKSRFAGFTQRRTGVYSELGTIDAMLKYIDIAEYKLAYDPVVAKAREAAEVIRQSAAMSPGVEEKPTIQNLEPLLDYLDQWANKLAGKTVREDRTLMGYVSRAGLKLAKVINSRVKANAIVGNAMSAVAQVCNIPVAASFVSNPADWVGGATLMVRAHHGNGGEAKAAFDNSPIMQQRYLDRRMRQVNPEGSSALQKLTNAMLEGGDLVSSELMWYSAYNMYNRLDGEVGSKFTRDYENAADFADDVVQRSVAARGAGDIPLTQQSELIKLLAPLQIEVNNQWQTLKSQLSKKTTGSRNIKSIVAMSVATYLLNELLELATGDRKAGFDFVQAFVDMYELFADDEGTVSSDVAGAAGRLGGEVLSGVPGGAYFGMLLTGGDDAAAEKLFGESDPTRYGVGNMGLSAWADPIISLIQGGTVDPLAVASNIVLPYGGKQVKRMAETAQNQGWIPDVQFSTGEGFTVRQAETPTSYSSTGRVRFAAEDDPLSILQSMLFGQYSTSAGRAYISGETKLLSEKDSETYNALAAAGVDGKDIMEQLNTLAGFKEIKKENYKITAAGQKREYIEDSDLTTAQQMILMGSIDDSFTENARAAKELGISNEQFLEYEYARVRIEVELQEYKRDHDGDAPPVAKSQQLKNWLRAQGLTEEQALYLYELHDNYKWKGWD